MTLKKMYPCGFHTELNPDYIEKPYLCSWCRGTLEWEGDVHFHNYKGEFKPLDYKTIGTKQEDFMIYVDCACGEEVFLGEAGDTKACNCGRVFRLYAQVKVDEAHIGEIDWLLEESEKEEKEHYRKWGIEKA